jgi:1,4-dihydroxy-2-naphthoate octaprenyltransferase
MVAGGYYVITGHFSASALLASIPYGFGVMSILVGKHIDQRDFDRGKHQWTLPVLLGEHRARALDRALVIGMYVVVGVGIAIGALSIFTVLVLLAAPRAQRAVTVLSAPAPQEPPVGYVGWPLWYHRVCLVHNRAFGWLYVLGLAAGAIFPGSRLVAWFALG